MSDYYERAETCECPIYDADETPHPCEACHACTEALEIDATAPRARTASMVCERDADRDGETLSRVRDGLEVSHDDMLRLAARGDLFEPCERDDSAAEWLAERGPWLALESEAARAEGRALGL